MSSTRPNLSRYLGVGLGLRWEFLEEVLAEVGASGSVDGIDFFEVAPENYMRRGGYFPHALEKVASSMPMLTHGLSMSVGGTDPLGDDYMRELRSFVDRFEPPFHSDHLCFCGSRGRMLHDLLPLPRTAASVRHVAARMGEISSRMERPFAVENISYYLVPGAADRSDAQFVADVVGAADGWLLFDVNNLYVNAVNHGFDPQEYLQTVPWDRVVQLHVAGHRYVEDELLLIDTHGAPIIDPVLELLADVVARTGPIPVLVERDNQVPPYAELKGEVAKVRDAYQLGLSRNDGR